MQDTNFIYELIVANDHSVDQTEKIVLQYRDKYPEIVKPVNNSKNIGATKNFLKAFLKASGSYIAICEGDDYWTDALKLQKQINFLDNRPNYVMCATRYKIVDEEIDGDHYELHHYSQIFKDCREFYDISLNNLYSPYLLKTLTVVFRNCGFEKVLATKKYILSDSFLWAYLLTKGNGACLNFFSGVYRKHGAGSWSKKGVLYQAAENYRILFEMNRFLKGYKNLQWKLVESEQNMQRLVRDTNIKLRLSDYFLLLRIRLYKFLRFIKG